MKKRILGKFMIVALSGTLAAGCVDKAKLGITEIAAAEGTSSTEQVGAPTAENEETGKSIVIECSVSLLDFSTRLAEAYGAGSSAISTGKEAALTSVSEGNCDFVLFSGTESDVESYEGVNAQAVGAEVIRLITDKGTAEQRQDLPMQDFYTLFIAEDDFGFEDAAADGTETEAGSDIALTAPGTAGRMLFEELFELRGSVGGMTQSLIPDTANEFDSDNEVVDFVKSNPGTIGVISRAAPEEVAVLSIDGMMPEDSAYLGQRSVMLAYKDGNSQAADFVSFLEADTTDELFGNSGISR